MRLTPQNFSIEWPHFEHSWYHTGQLALPLEGNFSGGQVPYYGNNWLPRYCITPSGHTLYWWEHRSIPEALGTLGPRTIDFPGTMVGTNPSNPLGTPVVLVCAPGLFPWQELHADQRIFGISVATINSEISRVPPPHWALNLNCEVLLGGALPPPLPPEPFSLPFCTPFLARKLGLPVKS